MRRSLLITRRRWRVLLTACLAALVGLSGRAQVPTTPSSPRIPLAVGLTLVKAFEMDIGDGESILRVTAADDRNVTFMFSGEVTKPAATGFESLFGESTSTAPAKPGANRFSVQRIVRRADLESARHYHAMFTRGDRAVHPESTAVGPSTLVLKELKSGAESAFSCQCASGINAMAGGLGSALGSLFGGQAPKELKELNDMGKLSGTLKRVESTTVPIPVLVNNVRVNLPAIHAKGQLGGEPAEFFFLDDLENPLTLRFRVGTQGLETVKISFPATTPAADIASVLESAGRVDVYGIYFDFGSATIKPESEPVLKEIASALTSRPTWKLGVEGHTDNVGTDADNLDLSRRRAAAVKDALVTRYKISGDRLTPAGFGESRPKEPNDSVAGRARNRRVELVKG